MLDPSNWDQILLALADQPRESPGHHRLPATRGLRHAVASHFPVSAVAGMQALRAGGSAADAVVAMTALDCVVCPGTSSLGGLLGVLMYDTESAKTATLNGGLHTLAGGVGDGLAGLVLVPGVVAGLYELWLRRGRLPWSEVLQPAVHVARHGFTVRRAYEGVFARRKAALLQHAEGRQIFSPAPRAGQRFVQPRLAETLDAIGSHGQGHIYAGSWSERLVKIARERGSTITGADLAAYEATWHQPLATRWVAHDVYATAPPHFGGAQAIAALNVLDELGHAAQPAGSAAALRSLVQASSVGASVWAPTEATDLRRVLRGGWARRRAAEIRAGRDKKPGDHRPGADEPGRPEGTATHLVAAVDGAGLLIVVLHSIHGPMWGEASLFVDGVAVATRPRPWLEHLERELGRGQRHPEPVLCFAVVSPHGRVSIGAACNSGWLSGGVQVISLLGRGDDVHEAIGRPRFGYTPDGRLAVEPMPPAVADEFERHFGSVTRIEEPHPWLVDSGLVLGVSIEPDGTRLSAVDPRSTGIALAE